MPKKYIHISLENGEKYLCPLTVIASIKANSYAKHKLPDQDSYQKEYQEEYDSVMSDDYLGVDYITNNMNWEDFKQYLIQLPKDGDLPTDYDGLWMSSQCEIIERDE